MTDNQATPRFPPAGWRVRQHGEYRAKGDMLMESESEDFSRAEPVAETAGRFVHSSDWLITLAPIVEATPAAAPTVKESLTVAPIISKTEITTEPKAAPEGAGTAPAREIQDLDRLERLLLDQGFRMDPEISYIRKALAERATLTAALAKAREALEFYATGTNWLSEGWQTSPAVHDHGKTARAALGNQQKGGGL